MHLDGVNRQGKYVYTVVVIDNLIEPQRPYRTPIIIEVPTDTKLPVSGASGEGDLLLAWYNAASEAEKTAYMTDPDPATIEPSIPPNDAE